MHETMSGCAVGGHSGLFATNSRSVADSCMHSSVSRSSESSTVSMKPWPGRLLPARAARRSASQQPRRPHRLCRTLFLQHQRQALQRRLCWLRRFLSTAAATNRPDALSPPGWSLTDSKPWRVRARHRPRRMAVPEFLLLLEHRQAIKASRGQLHVVPPRGRARRGRPRRWRLIRTYLHHQAAAPDAHIDPSSLPCPRTGFH